MVFTVILLAAMGLALVAGGARLLWLGGSRYYFIAGLAFFFATVLAWQESSATRLVYALIILGTLGWALWEVGFDWWPLGTRGGLVVLIGFWLLTPWALGKGTGWGLEGVALSLAILIALAVAAAALFRNPHDKPGRLIAQSAAIPQAGPVPPGEWHHYGRTLRGERYSPLDQITAANVGQLEVAWTYRTGDMKRPEDVLETTYEVTPLMAGGLLYLCTPHDIAIALDAATGKECWRFDPGITPDPNRQHQTCRGLSLYVDPARSGEACGTRIYLPTSDARLIALDAKNGTVCTDFGENGTVNLWANMPHQQSGFYYSTSPPVIARNLVIVGGSVNDNYAMKEPSGVVRAYDVNTGRLVWNFDSGNPDQTAPIAPDATYTPNSPNVWSVMSADEDLGLVYLPLGNQTPDQLGWDRSPAVERFSASITALDLDTGQVRWVFQTVHHDLWDMDVPAQPVLIDLTTANGTVPALVAPTKQGDIYVLDRRTGEPIIPVTSEPAPAGAIEPDWTAPTQPVSGLTFMPEPLQEKDLWGVSLLDQLACRIKFRQLRYEGRYTPPSLQGTLVYPGDFGVFNWGSVAVDPVRQVMFAMPTYLAYTVTLIPKAKDAANQAVKPDQPGANVGGPYAVKIVPFMSPLGLPCQAPPWGYVAGVDLRTGQTAYMLRNGTIRDAGPVPLPPIKLGVPGIGGPIITAGGVAFLAATIDNYLRAYDINTGAVLWQHRLPAGGQATPMSYEVNGRQFIVQVAGGHGSIGTKLGDYVIAYALPQH